MATSGDPIGSGFVASLARPGGNITGLSKLLADVGPKQLELLSGMVPKLSRVAMLFNPVNPSNLAAKLRLPSISGIGEYAEAGGLTSYGPHSANRADTRRSGARMIDVGFDG